MKLAPPLNMIQTITRQGILKKLRPSIDMAFAAPISEHLIFVEVGRSDDYDRLHIRNAVHLPADRIEQTVSRLLPDHGSEIILYGQNSQDKMVENAAGKLAALGYFNLFVYPGGKDDWSANSLWTANTKK